MRLRLLVPALVWAVPVFAQTAPARDTARDSLTHAPPLAPRPAVLRGLYVSRWAALGRRMNELIDVAKRTEVNALVIDVKDDRGYLLYRSGVPLARAIGADKVTPVPTARIRTLLDTMRANGIYPIARIVVAKDPTLANAKREWAVQRRADGKPCAAHRLRAQSLHRIPIDRLEPCCLGHCLVR